MDPKIEDIYRLTLENNRMLHKMRRGMAWGRIVTVVWWLLIIAVSGYAYYAYAEPYVQRIQALYAQLGQTNAQAQSLSSEVSNFFGNWLQQHPQTATTTPRAGAGAPR